MSFSVQFLGTGAALPTIRRNPSAQYIECNNRHILIDCGEGTQTQLRKFQIKFQKIKIILISHLHGDHYYGLMGLLSTMSLLGRNQDIHLYAPPELKEIIDLQLKASGHHYDFPIHFYPLKEKEKVKIYEDKKIEIYAFPLNHRVATFGFVISEKEKDFRLKGEVFKMDQVSLQAIPFFRKGENFFDENKNQLIIAKKYILPPTSSKSYAYCSDNAVLESQIQYLKNVDCLYHESTFIEKHKERAEKTKHSTAKQAAYLSKQSKVKKLYLGHISSRYEGVEPFLNEAKEIFSNVCIAEDGMKITV
ncbi:MAG: ribonuclease Z [Flavobacteriia bacterium]|nr:ribonuclease Z [Flavobacteriia bacterium]